MNEEERVEQERQEGWVKARYDCTMKSVFERLYDVVSSDITSFNELDRLKAYECLKAPDDPGVFQALPVERDQRDPVSVRFALHAKRIEITPVGEEPFTVTPQWDEDNLECTLFVDGESHTYPQISQKAIGALLFNLGVYPEARRTS